MFYVTYCKDEAELQAVTYNYGTFICMGDKLWYVFLDRENKLLATSGKMID